MAGEKKLSYTAEEIDERLGKLEKDIPTLQTLTAAEYEDLVEYGRVDEGTYYFVEE